MDNLNIHFPKSIIETFGESEGQKMLSRIEFHYTPKHASWLNMAEIEIGVSPLNLDTFDDMVRLIKIFIFLYLHR